MTPVNAEMRFYAIDGHDAIDTLAIILHITVIIERIGHLLIAKQAVVFIGNGRHLLIAKQAVVFIGNGLYEGKYPCIFDVHSGWLATDPFIIGCPGYSSQLTQILYGTLFVTARCLN